MLISNSWLTKGLHLILFIVLCLIWGTTWLAIKISIESVAPIMSAGLRMLIAFPVFFVFVFVNKKSLWFPKKLVPYFFSISAFYFTLPYCFIYIGQQYISSGLGGLLYSSMPVFILLFSVFILKERFFFSQIVGMMIGFFSLSMIIQLQYGHLHYSGLIGVFLVLLATIMHAIAFIVLKKARDKINIWTLHALPIGFSGILLICTSLITEQSDITGISTRSLLAIIYLALCALPLASIIYVFLLQRMNTIVFSFIFIIFPVIAVLISVWYENMPISEGFLFYVTVLLIGFTLTKFPIEQWKA